MRRARFPIVYFEIIGADGGRLRSCYSELSDWQFDVATALRGCDYASGRDDGVGVEGAVDAAPPGTSGCLTFYVAVAEVEATLARARRLGGTRIFGPDRLSDALEIGMFADPEGHVIGVQADGVDQHRKGGVDAENVVDGPGLSVSTDRGGDEDRRRGDDGPTVATLGGGGAGLTHRPDASRTRLRRGTP
jgi:predicted enzyme related to lactoylglutathione lyase